MAAPDWPDDVLEARSALREKFKPGTRVTHAYTGPKMQGEIVKLHVGTLKRQKHHTRWTASVRWDGLPLDKRPGLHALDLLRPVK